MQGRLAVIQMTLRKNPDDVVGIEVDGVDTLSCYVLLAGAAPAQHRPWPETEEILAPDRGKGRLDAQVGNPGGGHDLFRVGPPHNLQLSRLHLLSPPRPAAYVGCGIIAREMLVDLPPGFRLSFEDQPSWADRECIDNALGEYNAPFLRDPRYSYFGIFVRDANAAIQAGLTGNCYAGWLFVNLLWVDGDLRRQGIGRRLIAEAEQHALAFGCHSAYVDTFSFQAPDFYRNLGYEVFGTLDYPPDHRRIFLKKRLTPEIR